MSLLNIDKDILLYYICKYLEPKDVLNLSQTCKTMLELFPLNVRLRHVITILKKKAYPKKTGRSWVEYGMRHMEFETGFIKSDLGRINFVDSLNPYK